MKQKSVLVIGGSRFIGPHLLSKLISSKARITVFNRGNFQTKYKGVEYVQGDRHKDFKLLKNQNFDVVYDMYARNGQDTQQLIDEVKFEFLVHVGTAASYQRPTLFPVKEEQAQGEWFWKEYGKGKVECESVLAASNIQYASVRPTYVLGQKNPVNRERFIYSKLLNNETIVIPGNGNALVQFVFVEEVATTLFTIGDTVSAGAFNCAGNEYISITELVKSMADIVGKKAHIEFDPYRTGLDEENFPFANEHFIFDNSKIKKLRVKFAPLVEHLKKDWLEYYKPLLTNS